VYWKIILRQSQGKSLSEHCFVTVYSCVYSMTELPYAVTDYCVDPFMGGFSSMGLFYCIIIVLLFPLLFIFWTVVEEFGLEEI
jgi:hypothetical protein